MCANKWKLINNIPGETQNPKHTVHKAFLFTCSTMYVLQSNQETEKLWRTDVIGYVPQMLFTHMWQKKVLCNQIFSTIYCSSVLTSKELRMWMANTGTKTLEQFNLLIYNSSWNNYLSLGSVIKLSERLLSIPAVLNNDMHSLLYRKKAHTLPFRLPL